MALLKMQLNILVFISTTFISNLVVVKLPYLKSTMLCSKLSKGIGHNYYGEPAWPNDILYIFPVVIFGVTCLELGLAVCEPYGKSESANPFATPLEILPEWYFFATFNFLRILPSKLIGILSMLYLPGILLIIPFGENLNRYQNPFRRPIMVSIFLSVILYSIWLSIGPLEAIIKGLPLI
jgi:cytochrome b6-f complex subunit 4